MLRAYYQPANFDAVHGLSRDLGRVYIGYNENDERYPAEVVVKLVIPADLDVRLLFKRNVGYEHNFFASITMHSDGVEIMRELDQRGFLSAFKRLKAKTLYDLVQCFEIAGIPFRSDQDELMSREMWDMLHEDEQARSAVAA